MSNYLGDNHTKRLQAETDLKSTYTYFDENRKLLGIQSIAWIQKTAAGVSAPCATGWVEDDLYKWPGTYAGKLDTNGKYLRLTGTDTTGATIPAKAAQNSKFWKHGKFCVKRVAATNMVAATNGVCTTGQQPCSTCECATSTTWAAMPKDDTKTRTMQ
jgi:hypothetical protein